MKILVGFKNPKTGEIKHVKCGFSWTLLFFSGLFGLPLFLRRLNIWGIVFLILWVVNLLVGPFGANNAGLVTILFFVFLGLQFWLGLRGNEMTAKNYLEHDWIIADPNSEFTKLALRQWGISLPETTIKPENLVSQNVETPLAARPSGDVSILPVVIMTVVCVIGLLMYLGRNAEVLDAYSRAQNETSNISEKRNVQEVQEILVFPTCESPATEQALIQVVKNSPLGKTTGLELFRITEPRKINSTKNRINCVGVFITNAGIKTGLYSAFTLDELGDDNMIYFEFQLNE